MYKYSGKELDEENSLNWYYFGARYYDPNIGRWLSVDPQAFRFLGWSPYNYVYNSPLNGIDPDGEAAWLIGAVVGGGLDAALQIGISMSNGNSFGDAVSNIDLGSIGVSMASGAVGAGLATKISKLGTLAKKFGAEVLTDATASAAGQYVETGTVDGGNVILDVVAGQTIGKATSTAASKKMANSPTGQKLSKQAQKAKRTANNKQNKRSAASQRRKNQKATNAQNQFDEYVTGRAAATGSAAANTGSKTAKVIAEDENK